MILRNLVTSPRSLSSSPYFRTMASQAPKVIHFGPYEVTDQVFYNTPLSFCLCNIKPILPGHVLVIPYRQVQRLTDLTSAEVTDMFTTVQKVQKMLAGVYFCKGSARGRVEHGSFNVALQDGVESGQTVPHVHCHIIPRTRNPDEGIKGDEIYDRLQGEQGNVGGGYWDSRPEHKGKFPKIEDKDRHPRSPDVMRKEAIFYREQMELVGSENE